METSTTKRRAGFIRVNIIKWDKHSDAIKRSIGEERIDRVSRAEDTDNQTHFAAVDVVIIDHPGLDEVEIDASGKIPRYAFDLLDDPFRFEILGRYPV